MVVRNGRVKIFPGGDEEGGALGIADFARGKVKGRPMPSSLFIRGPERCVLEMMTVILTS